MKRKIFASIIISLIIGTSVVAIAETTDNIDIPVISEMLKTTISSKKTVEKEQKLLEAEAVSIPFKITGQWGYNNNPEIMGHVSGKKEGNIITMSFSTLKNYIYKIRMTLNPETRMFSGTVYELYFIDQVQAQADQISISDDSHLTNQKEVRARETIKKQHIGTMIYGTYSITDRTIIVFWTMGIPIELALANVHYEGWFFGDIETEIVRPIVN